MADYYPLIAKAVAGLDKSTAEGRRVLYDRARSALLAQLHGVDPPLTEQDINKERSLLEEAIRKVEREAAFRSRSDPLPSRVDPRPQARTEPVTPAPNGGALDRPEHKPPAAVGRGPAAERPGRLGSNAAGRPARPAPPIQDSARQLRAEPADPAGRPPRADDRGARPARTEVVARPPRPGIRPDARPAPGASALSAAAVKAAPEDPAIIAEEDGAEGVPVREPRWNRGSSLSDKGLKGFRNVVAETETLGAATAQAAKDIRAAFQAGSAAQAPAEKRPGAAPRPGLRADPQPIPPRSEPPPRSDPRKAPRTDARNERPESPGRAEPRAEPRPAARTEPRRDVRGDARPDTRPEARADKPRPQTPQNRPDPRVEPGPERPAARRPSPREAEKILGRDPDPPTRGRDANSVRRDRDADRMSARRAEPTPLDDADELPDDIDDDRFEPSLRTEYPTRAPASIVRQEPASIVRQEEVRGRAAPAARAAKAEAPVPKRAPFPLRRYIGPAAAAVLVLGVVALAVWWGPRIIGQIRSTPNFGRNVEQGIQADGGRVKDSSRIGQPSAEGTLVAQKVVLYEEDQADPSGKRYVGSAVWHNERLPPAPGQSPDLTIRADIEIPEQKIGIRWSLRRNEDKALPASHTIEIMFTLPADFPHSGISNIPGVLMKQGEATRGVPLAGLAVKVTTNFFLIGLSSIEADMQRNIQLLKERSWFDIPVVYGDGKRAIIAIEKGTPGERAFNDAFASWGQ